MEIEGNIELKSKSYFDVDRIKTDSFQELTQSLIDVHGDKLCFRFFENTWINRSFTQFGQNVFKYARFFIQKNLNQKNILILSESRPEILELYFASFAANTVSTPIDVKLAPKEIAYIIDEVKPEVIFVTTQMYQKLKKAAFIASHKIKVIGINSLPGHYCLNEIPENSNITLPQEDANKTGMIIYTSGSTGQMKGVETKGSQLLFQAYSILRVGFSTGHESNLSMLPMNHLFEVSGTISSICAGYGVCIAHSLEKEDLSVCFQKHRPTQIFSVPLFCKSIMNGVKLNISDSPLTKRIIFKILMFLAKTFPSMKFRRKLFSPIHQKFGGNLKRIIVGGAAADIAVINFFNLIGIHIYEGYGLTETAPVIAVNRVNKYKAGSVGPLIPGVKVRIDESSGEIQTKGPHVMQGYYKNPQATAEVLTEEGWLKTGDIGHIANEMLFITGRSKNLIILESGKKVHPEEVEKALDDIDFIKEISIFGDKSKNSSNSQNIICVAHLDESFMKKYGKQSKDLLTQEIEKRSERIAQYKLPNKIIVSKDELPKTTTMKVKHFQVAKRYEEGFFQE